ncbi:hypothetical protein [Thiocapsa rosea]|uniref:hypothetical protein n=1 Tax=Thiocapsa rosea TaxID=69360 RepID=UPI0011C3441E|nr:hypothetical protein [Thiocapsa rosea]
MLKITAVCRRLWCGPKAQWFRSDEANVETDDELANQGTDTRDPSDVAVDPTPDDPLLVLPE